METQENRVGLHADAAQEDQTLSGMETGKTTGQQSQLNCNSPSPSSAVESPVQTEGASTQSSGDDSKSVCSGSGRSSRLKLASDIVADVVNNDRDDLKETLDKVSNMIISGDYSGWNVAYHNKLSCRPIYTCDCGLISYGPHSHCNSKNQVICFYNALNQIENWNIQEHIGSVVKDIVVKPQTQTQTPNNSQRSRPSSVVSNQPKDMTFESFNRFCTLESLDSWDEPIYEEFVMTNGDWTKIPNKPNSQTPKPSPRSSINRPNPKPRTKPPPNQQPTPKPRITPKPSQCRPEDSVSSCNITTDTVSCCSNSTRSLTSSFLARFDTTTNNSSTLSDGESLGPPNNKIIYKPPWYKRLFTKKSVFDFEKQINHEIGQIPNKINKTRTKTIVPDDLIIPELYNHLRKHEFESYTNREAKMAHMIKLAVKLDLQLDGPLMINKYYATIQKVVDSVDTKFLLTEVNPTYTRSRLKSFFSKRSDRNFQ